MRYLSQTGRIVEIRYSQFLYQYSFLVIFYDFTRAVLSNKDKDDGMQIFNFTDGQFEELRERMLLVDAKAIYEKGFWRDELEMLLSGRDELFKNDS